MQTLSIVYAGNTLEIEVLHETSDFLVINKPPEVSVHKDEAEEGLVSLLAKALSVAQLFLVHRLDKVTSGALVLAKTSLAASKLSQSFQHRTVRKCYIAISDKKPKKKQGLIKGDMVKSRRGAWRLSQTMNAPAQTRFTSYAYQPGLRVFFVRPITGKTHQIRVALKSISAPIIGDKYYHETVQPAPDRTYLHAYWLSFRYDGQDYEVIAPPRQGRLFDQAFCQWLCDTLPSPSALWD